jgi:hypothetical protein
MPAQGVHQKPWDAGSALFDDLTPQARADALQYVFDDDAPVEWSEEDIVLLHWRLLQELAGLGDPGTPLDQKLDTLHWVFAEPDRDDQPFSFVSCLKVVGCSVLSPTPYFGPIDADAIRGWIRHQLPRWLGATLARYPAWVKEAILRDPAWAESRLARNPQWLNGEIRRRAVQGDLFA